jgi:hypothetical protein
MMTATTNWPKDDAERIRRALSTEGGHLGIGRGGFTLYYARGSTLSGYNVEPMKAACVAAGLPIIDSRMIDFNTALDLAVKGPMIAVGEAPSPQPWHSFAYAPLTYVAGLYRAAGAEVINLPDS